MPRYRIQPDGWPRFMIHKKSLRGRVTVYIINIFYIISYYIILYHIISYYTLYINYIYIIHDQLNDI